MSKKKKDKSISIVKRYFIFIIFFSFIFVFFLIFFNFYEKNKNIIINTVLKQTNNKIFYLKNNVQIAVYSKNINPVCSLFFPSNINCLFNYKNFKIVFLLTKNKKKYQFPLVTVPELNISISKNVFSSFSPDEIFNNFILEGRDVKLSRELIKVFKLAKNENSLTSSEYNLLINVFSKYKNYFKYQIKKKKYNFYTVSTNIIIKNFLNVSFKSYIFFDKKLLRPINKIKYIKVSFKNPLKFQKIFYLIYKSLSLFIDIRSLNNQFLGVNSNQLLSFQEFKKQILKILSFGYSNCIKKGLGNESQCFNLKILKDVFSLKEDKKLTIEKNF